MNHACLQIIPWPLGALFRWLRESRRGKIIEKKQKRKFIWLSARITLPTNGLHSRLRTADCWLLLPGKSTNRAAWCTEETYCNSLGLLVLLTICMRAKFFRPTIFTTTADAYGRLWLTLAGLGSQNYMVAKLGFQVFFVESFFYPSFSVLLPLF